MSPGVEGSRSPDELDRRLQEVDALRRRVLNVIPHALRTPITTFRGLADALSRATNEEIRDTIAPALQRLAAQAEHLLDDMLLASGLSTTLPTGDRKPTPVSATASAVWTDLAPDREPLRVEGGDVEVLAVEGVLFKILVHLLDNAAKYGTGDPVVRVEEAGKRVRIVVDSPGAEITELESLTEPFFRSEKAVMHSAGLGVGLTVARALAEHAGGTLEIAARPGGGLLSTVELDAA